MSNHVGKTVARIVTEPTENGYQHHDRLLIVFTDGSALEVTGSSYEEVSLGFDEVDADRVKAYERAAQGRREQERLRRLEREEWLSVSCDERAARRDRRRAKMGAFSRLVREEIEGAMMDTLVMSQRASFGGGYSVRYRCKNCGERECPNAETKHVPGVSLSGGFSAITIPVKR